MQKKNCLHEEDISALSNLMNNGFSLQDALTVIKTPGNQDAVNQIIRAMEKGMSSEASISPYIPLQMKSYFTGFVKYMPMQDTLDAVIAVVDNERRQKETIVKGMLYPSLLFIGVNIGVLAFNSYIMPTMMNLMAGFNGQNDSILLFQKVFTLLSKAVLLLICIGAAGLYYCMRPDHIKHTYQWVQRRFPRSLLVKYASADFSRFFLECVRRRISTKETLDILCSLKEKPLVRYLAEVMNEQLLAGNDLPEAVASSRAEEALIRIFKISLYASNCTSMLEGYLKMVNRRTDHEIRTYSKIVQCCSYAAVAVVLIIVYQVLLMPMNIMETL